jgi:hypothetical protein
MPKPPLKANGLLFLIGQPAQSIQRFFRMDAFSLFPTTQNPYSHTYGTREVIRLLQPRPQTMRSSAPATQRLQMDEYLLRAVT